VCSATPTIAALQRPVSTRPASAPSGRTARRSAAFEALGKSQKALLDGDVYKALSTAATACRLFPAHPDLETSLAWTRYRAEVQGGKDRAETARRERAVADGWNLGRRPWPRTLVALGLLCAADGDPDSARWHLHEALEADPTHASARQLLQRLSTGRAPTGS
jgi:hypothetical protein